MDPAKSLRGVLLALVMLLAAGAAVAGEYAIAWNPRSGDPWVDARLADINDYAGRHREPFVDEMVRYHDAPRDLVSELLQQRRWAPGDVYYACSIARVLGRPCRYVVDEWTRTHADGWGALTQRLGIVPGSAESRRLKQGFAATYRRWGRPLAPETPASGEAPADATGGGAQPRPATQRDAESGEG